MGLQWDSGSVLLLVLLLAAWWEQLWAWDLVLLLVLETALLSERQWV